ncbi:MAG: hypothetical protein LLF94_09100, partial [Chlamydiales bacterium]|nr:hypothetical protein [Chlamydiales bacterium]
DELLCYEYISSVTREPPKTTTSGSKQAVNTNSGHYAAYVHYDAAGKDAYMQYNYSSTMLHTDTAGQISETIKQDARLHIYECRGPVLKSSLKKA